MEFYFSQKPLWIVGGIPNTVEHDTEVAKWQVTEIFNTIYSRRIAFHLFKVRFRSNLLTIMNYVMVICTSLVP